MPNVRAPVFFDFRSPLSGSVNQLIQPWRWSMDGNNNQYSFFSIDLGHSSAPELETEIIEEVGSYGRQLGRISEALEVLVKRLPRGELNDAETAAIEAFSVQMREIAQVRKRMASRTRS
jgi:hypothetical protein